MALLYPFGQTGLVIPSRQPANTLERNVGGLGPEIAPAFLGSNWTLDLKSGAAGTVVQDATGITFAAANNITNCNIATLATMVDNAFYQVTYTVTGWTSGTFKVLVDGATVNHGAPTTSKGANGTYTEVVGPLSGVASNTNRIFFQALAANGANSFKVTAISVKRVL